MKKFGFYAFAVAMITFLISGCLTVEKKEYTFEFTGKNSGILTIKYYNIMSVMDDTLDVSDADFDELISSYLYGEEIENEFPYATNIQKNLYEEDGVLCAEVTLEFDDLEAAHLFQYDTKSPFMFNLGSSWLDSETYFESNGVYGGEQMPVVFWDSGIKMLKLTTQITTPDETTMSLAGLYRDWKGE